MQFEEILAFVILASVIIYAISGGADYGGGMWDLLASGPRARRQRETIANAIGPIWEANHVWLILVVVLLFSVFPAAFSAMMTALNIPMTLVLVGIVLRGTAFIFRKYDVQHDTVHRRWSKVFGVASMWTPFCLGVCLGALASGAIRVVDDTVTTGFFAGWTQPFAIACGLFAQGLFAFLAAAYLTVDSERMPDLQEDFRRRALVSALSLAPAAALVSFLARDGAPGLFENLMARWAPLLLLATSLCAIGALVSLWFRHFRWARAAAAAQVVLILLGWGLAQYPHLIVPDVTVSGAATSASTLRLITWTLAVGALVLLPAFGYLFYLFKGQGGLHQASSSDTEA